MAKRFYVVFLEDGKREVLECRIHEIGARLRELKADLLGEGDSREEALAQADKAPKAGWYSGSSSFDA